MNGALVAAVMALALGFCGAWKVQEWRYGAREAERLVDAAAVAARIDQQADAAGVVYEKEKAHDQVRIRTITQRVAEIVERPVYRNVCFDDDGLRQLGAAIRGEPPPAIEPGGALPGPARPEGRDGGGGAELGG